METLAMLSHIFSQLIIYYLSITTINIQFSLLYFGFTKTLPTRPLITDIVAELTWCANISSCFPPPSAATATANH